MRERVFDIEANGLEPTEVFCVVVREVDSKRTLSFRRPCDFNDYLEGQKETTWYAHNGIRYDYPVLSRLWGTVWDDVVCLDTLVLSRLYNPSLEGGHSLRAWGQRLGFPKGDHDDFSRYSEEMLRYCKKDVDVTCALLDFFRGNVLTWNPECREVEHAVARIIFRQEQNGWKLDCEKATQLVCELVEKRQELEENVRKVFIPYAKAVKTIEPKYKADGTMSIVGLKWYGENALTDVCGPLTRIEFPPFNLGSRQQIGEYLQRFGWEPKEFTETGQPKVDETILEGVDIPQAQLIAEYMMVQKRVAMLESWLDAVEDDGRVHGVVNSNGAVTGRMTHNSPNMAQVVSNDKPYGKPMRGCWTAEDGYKVVGCDADGLELRMLAHYMNDPDYAKAVVEGDKDAGTDAHTRNQRAAGLPDRASAKTFIYAFLYGAGDSKIGSIVGGGPAEGAALKRKFLDSTPALKSLRGRVEGAAGRGYMVGLDGRHIIVRSRHAALNTLLQGAGALVMKKALMLVTQWADEWRLDYKHIGNIHDEFQFECAEKHAERLGKLASYAIQKAGEHYNLRVPLAGTYEIGDSWAETH